VTVGVGAANLVIAVIALWAARQVGHPGQQAVSWPDHVGRAATILAALGAVLAVITVLGALLVNR
jgi:hypothetical protein